MRRAHASLKRLAASALAASVALLPMHGFAASPGATDPGQARAIAALDAHCDGSAPEPATSSGPENPHRKTLVLPRATATAPARVSRAAAPAMLAFLDDEDAIVPRPDVPRARDAAANAPEVAAFALNPLSRMLRDSAIGARGATRVLADSSDDASPSSGVDATRASTLNTAPQTQDPTASPAPAATPTAAASPLAGGTAAPLPAQSFDPYRGVLRGPGVLIATTAPSQPAVTPPPIPTPTPDSTGSPGPVYLTRPSADPVATGSPDASGPSATTSASPAPTATAPAQTSPAPQGGGAPGPSPSVAPTLGPDQIAIIADEVNGATRLDRPADAVGNVHVFYRDGVMIGERAHYDGQRYITMTGHPYLQNNEADTKLYADHIVFDMQTNSAILQDGNGASSRGVQQGRIHYRADRLEATSGGRVHGEAASFSTCENPRGGYHISARSIDVTPGQKLIARSATVFLGGLAIFFIPFLSIPLNRSDAERRPVFFAPQLGYDDADGFYVKARLGFGSTNTYYGYYRVEEYTKRGLGLGYVAFIGSRNGNRQINVNAYHFRNRQTGGNTNNLTLNDSEQFSRTLQGQFGATYLSEFGPYVSLPPSYSFNGTVNHATERSQQAYSFSRTAVGGTQSTINAAFQDNYRFSPFANQSVSLNFSQNTNSYSGITTPTSSLHINTLTHATSSAGDFTLAIDKTNAQTPSNYNKVPEFIFHPRPLVGTIPIDTQFTLGQYTEATDTAGGALAPHKVVTPRGQFDLTAGPAIFRVLGSSTFTATLGLSQYAYGTGDLKAQTRQTANLSTPIGRHVVNTIQYQQQNLAGPQAQPFQYLDVLGGVTHNAQEALTISNGGIYSLTLTTATAFDHNAQPISYQLISRPSQRSYLSVGGSYNPGVGNGFTQTNIQIATPIGKDQEIEFTTNVDWKSRGRLRNKNIYFRKIVGNCYDVRLSYNQDLKAVNLTLNLLAFPSQGANFGFSNQQRAIFPQSFVFQ